MTELSALHVKITGDANGLKGAVGTAMGEVDKFSKSAESSARVFERAFAQNEKSVENLRRAIDPLYAASKRYEAAVGTLDKALKMGTINQAEHTRMLGQAGAAYLNFGGQAEAAAAKSGRLGGALGALGNMSQQTRGRVQNVSFQLADMAVQFQAGTRASVVFAQQGSQIAAAFGPVGAVIGALAAIGIPALAFAFASAGSQTISFKDALDQAEGSLAKLRDTAAVFSAEGVQGLIDKYGELNTELLKFIEAQRQQAVDTAMRDATAAAAALREEFGGAIDKIGEFGKSGSLAMGQITKETGLSMEQVRALKAAFDNLRNASTFDQQVAAMAQIRDLLGQSTLKGGELYGKFLDAEDMLRQMNAEGAKASGWLGAAIGGAEALAGKFWEAAKAAAAMRDAKFAAEQGDDGRGSQRKGLNDLGAFRSRQAVSARMAAMNKTGGGGGVNPITGELETLKNSLMTQEQAQIESYARQQETLAAALEQRLITQQEYAALMEAAQAQNSDNLAQIDAYRYGDGLQKAGAYFGAMATAFASGNDKMAAIGKKFAAIEALINAWRAYAQTLADPSLPFFAKFAAAASVLAAGMSAVSAIKGGGKGGGGASVGAASGGAANSPAPPPQSKGSVFNVQLVGGDNYGPKQIQGLISSINKAIEDGATLKGIRLV